MSSRGKLRLLDHNKEKRKREEAGEPHSHRSSRSQWELQVLVMTDNLDNLQHEFRTYVRLHNTIMKYAIQAKINQAKRQLQKKLEEKPPKDRPQDILNNNWCREVCQE